MNDAPDESQLRTLIGQPASRFVKHREPMLFLDRLVDIGTNYALCEWQLDSGSPLCLAGLGVPAYFGVEYMAQCVAVHSGACANVRGNAPPLGLLLGTRQFASQVQYFALNTAYRARCVEVIRDKQGMGSFACHIECAGEILATANLAVLELKSGLDEL